MTSFVGDSRRTEFIQHGLIMLMLLSVSPPATGTGDATHWKYIWTRRVILKIRVFLLKMVLAIIPIKINLNSRLVNVDPFYCWCGLEVKTNEHVFRDCEWVHRVWGSCPLTVAFSSGPMEEWTCQNMKQFNEETFCLFCYNFVDYLVCPESTCVQRKKVI